MNCNKIIVSLFLFAFAPAVMGMDRKKFNSPDTIARTFSCEYPSQGVLLVPKVVQQGTLEQELAQQAQLSQQKYPRKVQEGVLLMPQVLRERAAAQEFYKRKNAGAFDQELSKIIDAFKSEERKKYWNTVRVSQKYQPKNHKKNDDDASDCWRLFLECFG